MTTQIGMTGEQISALEMLAGHPGGCPESEMKAKGFTIGLLGGLIRAGLATATPAIVETGGRALGVVSARQTVGGAVENPDRRRSPPRWTRSRRMVTSRGPHLQMMRWSSILTISTLRPS
jgi:hypothetical protein